MTYDGLVNTLKYLDFNKRECNIRTISSKVLRLAIENNISYGSDRLSFRLGQAPELLQFEEIEELFGLRKYIRCSLEKPDGNDFYYVDRIFKKDDDRYTKVCEECVDKIFGDDTHAVSREKVIDLFFDPDVHSKLRTIVDNYKEEIKGRNDENLYLTLGNRWGDYLLDMCRYELEPLSYEYLVKIYEALADNRYGIKDKEVFTKLCSSNNFDDIQLFLNVVSYLNAYNLSEEYKDELFGYIKTNDFDRLYDLYKRLISTEKQYQPIMDIINRLLSKDEISDIDINELADLVRDFKMNHFYILNRDITPFKRKSIRDVLSEEREKSEKNGISYARIEENKSKIVRKGSSTSKLEISLYSFILDPSYNEHDESDLNVVTTLLLKGATAEKNDDTVLRELLYNPSNINKSTILHDSLMKYLVTNKLYKTIFLLISYGYDISTPIDNNYSLIEYCIIQEDVYLLDILLSMGIDINATFNSGNTLLCLAIKFDLIEIVKYLISKGSSVNAYNANGQSPLDVAIHYDCGEIKELLVNELNKLGEKPVSTSSKDLEALTMLLSNKKK